MQNPALTYALMAVINVTLSTILCQKYDAIGCAIGTAISLIVVQGVIINVYYQKKCHINVRAFWKSILKMAKGLVLPAVFGIVVCLVKDSFSLLELVLTLGIFVLIYIPSMYWLGMTAQERRGVVSLLKRKRTA